MVNWTFQGEEIKSAEDTPEGSIGFIYKITNVTNGKYYYGRKTFRKLNKKKKLTKKEKALPENKRKQFKYVPFEYKGWQKYTGSSDELNADIKKGDKYKKEIIHWCYKKAELTFYECRAIVCSECLLDEMCYNKWVSAKIFKNHLI